MTQEKENRKYITKSIRKVTEICRAARNKFQ